ncbi:uncharacterized protein MELLADRAFT_89152 [Melampsora larici-populina 98AG31]|uniref:FAR1 domain-containing protein n=1 Tax=Melampsora larici-populina (strain 98AG31 / pathotype 3-4-7) TaxID=747676 RepID=F4R549_MELLP|nr:uncharacterized protein MELLADRAFT_89152 [Melampsora larici-populina 98AG31]EGG12330.1 hypothetical protein MELLADRAFT_89152 [Melampsora larici-populina 98AG31]
MSHLNESTIINNSNPFNYPNPIPPPSTDTTYPNLALIETYIFTHAAHNGFEISIGDTRKNHMKYKCSLGPHGHKTKALTNPSTASLPSAAKTCPYKVSARRPPNTHEWRVEIIHGTHDHPPHSKPPVVRQPPKSRQQPVEVEEEVSKSDKPQHQPSHSSQPSSQPQLTHPLTQYDALLSRMDRLPSDTRARLLKRFLHECEVVQYVLCDSGTLLENNHSTKHLKPKTSKPSKPSITSKTTNPEQTSQQPNPESNPNTNTNSHNDSEGEPLSITQSNNINPITQSISGNSIINESVSNKSDIDQAGTSSSILKSNSEDHTTRPTEEQPVFQPTIDPPDTVQSPHSTQQDLSLQIQQTQVLRNHMQNEKQLSPLSPPQPAQPTLKVVNINEELPTRTHSPPQSDCSSTSHQAEELLIITSLTPRKKKQEPAVNSGSKQEVHQSKMQERYHLNPDPFTSETASSNGTKQALISDKEPTSNTITDTSILPTEALELVLNPELTTAENDPSNNKPHISIDSKRQLDPPQLDPPSQDNQNTVLSPIINTIEPRVKSRKRKFESNGPRQPTRVLARRKAAETQKDKAQLQKLHIDESCTNPVSATLTPEITPSATGLVTGSSTLILDTAQKSRRVQKPNFLKHMSPEELKEEEEIRATVLQVVNLCLSSNCH